MPLTFTWNDSTTFITNLTGLFDSRIQAEKFRKDLPLNELNRGGQEYKINLFIDPDWSGSSTLLTNQTYFRSTLNPDVGAITGVALSMFFALPCWCGLSWLLARFLVRCTNSCLENRCHCCEGQMHPEDDDSLKAIMFTMWAGIWFPFCLLLPVSTARSVDPVGRQVVLVLMCLYATVGLMPFYNIFGQCCIRGAFNMKHHPLCAPWDACSESAHMACSDEGTWHKRLMGLTWFLPGFILFPIALCLENPAVLTVAGVLVASPIFFFIACYVLRFLCIPCSAVAGHVEEKRSEERERMRQQNAKARELAARMLDQERDRRAREAQAAKESEAAQKMQMSPLFPSSSTGGAAGAQFIAPEVASLNRNPQAVPIVAVPVPASAPTPGVTTVPVVGILPPSSATMDPEVLVSGIAAATTEEELVDMLVKVKEASLRPPYMTMQTRSLFIVQMRNKKASSPQLWSSGRVAKAYGDALRARNM